MTNFKIVWSLKHNLVTENTIPRCQETVSIKHNIEYYRETNDYVKSRTYFDDPYYWIEELIQEKE